MNGLAFMIGQFAGVGIILLALSARLYGALFVLPEQVNREIQERADRDGVELPQLGIDVYSYLSVGVIAAAGVGCISIAFVLLFFALA